MKGTTVENILKNLSVRKYNAFLKAVQQSEDGEGLAVVCGYLRKRREAADGDMAGRFKMTKWERTKRINQIGDRLIALLGGKGEGHWLETIYQLAHDLVFDVKFDAAADLISMGIKQAEETEKFEMVLRFWGLVEPMEPENPMDPGPKIQGMTKREAHRLLSNLAAYEDLQHALGEARLEADAIGRRKALEHIRDSKLLQDPANALSKRAAFWHWKVNSSCRIHLRDHLAAIPAQQRLIAHIESHPWVCLDGDYCLAREIVILGLLFQRLRQRERFREVSEGLQAKSFKNTRAEQEKSYLRFPSDIAAAIQFGNREEGARACNDFLQLMADGKFSFSPGFLTENLYCCTYFFLAVGDVEAAGKVLGLFRRQYERSDFRPRLFVMSRFLEIIHAIERKDWVDAATFIKNLNSSSGLEELPGIKQALLFLSHAIDMWAQNPENENHLLARSLEVSLRESILGQDFLEYFDLLVWLEARRTNRPMIEIFNHRANLDSQGGSTDGR